MITWKNAFIAAAMMILLPFTTSLRWIFMKGFLYTCKANNWVCDKLDENFTGKI